MYIKLKISSSERRKSPTPPVDDNPQKLECDGIVRTMKEMVGGCCVCSDERGWPDNPLVYCDGNGCTVAVHQACYGIITVPLGPWFCRKCESPDRQTKVRCELCPSRSGALKRADSGGWAHVVCALYIPEVRFGNVTSMEPIILQLIPSERYNKTCYICQDLGKIHRANVGACMQCNKSGCKQQFHVTCAQGLGLLCEEAGNYLDNVKYCGYCQHHYSKLKKGGNVKTIPPYKPVSQDSHSSDSGPEKEGEASSSGGSALSPTLPVVVTSPPVLNNPVASTSKSTTNKSSSGGRKSNNQLNSLNSNVRCSTTKTSTASSQSISSTAVSSASATTVTIKQQNQDKTQDKSGIKKWSGSPPQGQVDVMSLNSSSSANNTVTNSISRPVDMSASDNNENKGQKRFPKNTNTKFSTTTSKSTAVITNTNSSTLNIGSVISTPPTTQSGQQNDVNLETKDKMVSGEGDMAFAATGDMKQAKKRKAISQSAAQDLSLHNNDSNTSSNNTIPRERSFGSGDRTPDSTNDEKIKKIKIDTHGEENQKNVIANTPQGFSSGLNIQMEPNLSSNTHIVNSGPPPAHTPPVTSTITQNISTQIQAFPVERSLPSHMNSTILGSAHSSNPATANVPHTMTSNMHIQPISSKYAKDTQPSSDVIQTDIPSSLLVSVPLSQSGQGLNLSAHQNAIPSEIIPMSVSPQASSGNWGLKISYEPQTNQNKNMKMHVDPNPPYPTQRRRMEPVDVTKTGIKNPPPGPVILDTLDKMTSIANTGVRNKKRVAMPANVTNITQSSINATNIVNNLAAQPGPSKRIAQATPPPTASTSYQESPPRSPNSESNRAKALKYSIQRLSRAPHMLGNELNPDSAAAARLSEHLSAELAAHSVFRAPSPLVAPPLFNRATNSGRLSSTTANTSTSGLVTGGAQSLDQLLERQWEQGSQFLMEQAQHFDIASLLSCLHQLRTENVNLEEHVLALTERRDHLLAVNARLAIPLNSAPNQTSSESNRVSRDPTGISRQPSSLQSQRNDIMAMDRNQQVLMRDMQPKPS